MRVNKKVSLITGSAEGIGRAVAEIFHKEGSTVIISDIQKEKGEHLAKKLGGDAHFLYLDVSEENSWKDAYSYIKNKFGKLDILVNNAGTTGFLKVEGPFNPEDISLNSWDYIHKINLTGTMLGCKYAIKLMKHSGGSIVNISSRSGIVGIPAASAYASSKAGVRNFTKSVALYCAEKKYNIRCNSIHPAAIMTSMWNDMLGEGSQRDMKISQIEKGIPLGSFGLPEDVAYGALYLASNESKYVTGSELNIDGGILAGSEAKPQ